MFKARCTRLQSFALCPTPCARTQIFAAGGRWENEENDFIKPIASSFAVLGSRSTGQESAGRSQQTDNLAFSSRCQ